MKIITKGAIKPLTEVERAFAAAKARMLKQERYEPFCGAAREALSSVPVPAGRARRNAVGFRAFDEEYMRQLFSSVTSQSFSSTQRKTPTWR